VAYVEFLRANGIEDPSYLRDIDYQEVLNSQEMMAEELELLARKETQKDVVVAKRAGEALGVVIVESGWGSMLPTSVIANMAPGGAASRSNQLNIGDQIIGINGISLVGLPLSAAQQNIKASGTTIYHGIIVSFPIQNARSSTAVRLTVVSTPPVVEVRIRWEYQKKNSKCIMMTNIWWFQAARYQIPAGFQRPEWSGQSPADVPKYPLLTPFYPTDLLPSPWRNCGTWEHPGWPSDH
jgi:hypothetical protein